METGIPLKEAAIKRNIRMQFWTQTKHRFNKKSQKKRRGRFLPKRTNEALIVVGAGPSEKACLSPRRGNVNEKEGTASKKGNGEKKSSPSMEKGPAQEQSEKGAGDQLLVKRPTRSEMPEDELAPPAT